MEKNTVISETSELTLAVTRIQRVWRRYIDIQVFKYYKDLVLFHNEGSIVLLVFFDNFFLNEIEFR